MTEDNLKKLSLNAVLNLMSQHMKDLLEAKNNNDQTEIRNKEEQVDFLKKFLCARRAEFPPGISI
jgi:hypothetical protein